MSTIYIGLGSNIDPENNLRAAAALLREKWPMVKFSSVYKTKAREVEEQPDFLNAVAKFETDESPEEVFETLKKIETELGKKPPYRFGPRTIDLDLLLYGDLVSNKRINESTELFLPHQRLHERRFVLEPLLELIDPDSNHPVLEETWANLLKQTEDQSCEPIELSL